MDVAGWLRGLGLDQYEANFRDNKIDADVLPQLTADDLKDIGVSAVGDRRRLLAAIAALSGQTPSANAPAPAKGLEISAERRPITVMFCDLVGSTSLAAKMDAEDWRNLVGAYLDAASAAVTGLGGHVLKKLGDGLMALFGYPQAQENDAERAVRAALAIQRALVDLNARNARAGAPELAARIGLDIGPVVVDAAGEVFGEAPNVAARVQAAADPGTVLVTASVQRQTAGLFVAEDRGAHELKGVPQPVTLYRIVRASGGGRRGGARALTPLVGREDELSLLMRRWVRARERRGPVRADRRRARHRQVAPHRGISRQDRRDAAHLGRMGLLAAPAEHASAPGRRMGHGCATAAPMRATRQRLADLENTLTADRPRRGRICAPSSRRWSTSRCPRTVAAKFPPEELRRRQLAAMTAWFLAGARSQPVVLAFEDLHWADPTSLDLMARARRARRASAALFIVATTRPEFRAPWAMRSHHSVISLAPLDRAQVRRMVGEIASRHALSDETIDGVGERTGGVPLFVEEVTRLLIERDTQGGAQAIPPTLQQSLAARLDRLGEAREVAQIGAVLGRDFSYRLLSDVSSSAAGIEEPRLHAALDRLTEADLLFVDGAPPTAAYRFKHALIQDAAYESLLKSSRQTLHRRAAEALREADAEPEAIAHHFTEAGLDDAAIEWWGRAGDQALRRSAFQEAIAHLGKAIAMADKAGGGSTRASTVAIPGQRLKLQSGYGQAMMWSKGFAADETKKAFERAAALATNSDDFSERFSAAHGQWTIAIVRSELESGKQLASAFLRQAEDAGRVTEAGVAHRGLALMSYFLGDFVEARTHCERALANCDPQHEEEARERYGEYTSTLATAFLANCSWQLGNLERAHVLIDTANQRAKELGHPPSMANPLFAKSFLAILRGDKSAALGAAEALEELARVNGMTLQRTWGKLLAGWARGRLHDAAAGAAELLQGLADLAEDGQRVDVPFYNALLADLEVETLGADRALARLEEALDLAGRINQRSILAFMHRLRGEILLKRDPVDSAPAEESFRRAIAVATDQGARSPLLQAALALAKLYQSTGRPADAHAVLAPGLEGFAPTPEMPEIAEAQALLSALAESDAVKAAIANRERQLHLHTAYGQAMMWSKGFTAEETQAAFARAGDLAGRTDHLPEQFDALQGQWAAACTRGELQSVRERALAFLCQAEEAGRFEEAGIANFWLGLVAYWRGDFVEARTHYERGLAAHDPNPGPKARDGFGDDATWGSAIFAVIMWQLGEVERARELTNWATQRASEIGHVGGIADVLFWKSYLEIWRGDPVATLSAAEALERVAREYGVVQYLNEAELHYGWANGRINDPTAGAAQVRRVLAAFVDQGVKVNLGFYSGLLAELEAETLGADRALARIGEALRLSDEVEHRCSLPFLHRLRGEILLRRDPADPVLAEEAFRTSIAVAKEQGARSPLLLASLSLAKLYHSTDRPLEAHDVLAPALEGFSPTPEMLEIAEAQALLAALAETEEVKAAEAQRRRLTQLHVAHGNALIAARGFGAAETADAFAKARESAAGGKDAPERLAAEYGLWAANFVRGELPSMRAHSSAFLGDVESRPDSPEAGVAHRAAGITCWVAGEYAQARDHLERALALFQPGRDDDLAFRFGPDPGVLAMHYLALTLWPMGDIGRAVSLVGRAEARIADLTHVGTLAPGRMHAAMFDLMRGDGARVAANAFELTRLAREFDLNLFRAFSVFLEGWSSTASGASGGRLEGMRRGVELLREQNVLWFDGLLKMALAQAEAQGGDPGRAIATLDNALATCDRTGCRAFEAELHRARGEILLKRDPANSAPAEDALATAIVVAKQQGTRSFGLRAAISLAKLYQSTGRPADAHAVLAPALEGFAPTPEMPEIAEAQALLAG